MISSLVQEQQHRFMFLDPFMCCTLGQQTQELGDTISPFHLMALPMWGSDRSPAPWDLIPVPSHISSCRLWTSERGIFWSFSSLSTIPFTLLYPGFWWVKQIKFIATTWMNNKWQRDFNRFLKLFVSRINFTDLEQSFHTFWPVIPHAALPPVLAHTALVTWQQNRFHWRSVAPDSCPLICNYCQPLCPSVRTGPCLHWSYVVLCMILLMWWKAVYV